jgi:hypothetical protein
MAKQPLQLLDFWGRFSLHLDPASTVQAEDQAIPDL